MKKSVLLFFIVVIIFSVGCKNKSYTKKKIDNGFLVENRIKNASVKKLKVIKSFKTDRNKRYYYVHIFKDRLVGLEINDNKMYVTALDHDLNLIKKSKYEEGKGPGEFLRMCALTYNNGKYYFADGNKKTIEVFDEKFNYQDTILLKSEVSSMYRSPSSIIKTQSGYYFSPSIPYVLIKINENGKIGGFVKSEKSVETHPHRIWGWNYSIISSDENGNIYMTFPSRGKLYQIRKYDKNLNLIWKNNIRDKYNDILNKRNIVKIDKSIQPEGPYKMIDIDVNGNNIYILRGVGGEQVWNKDKSEYHFEKISEIDTPFIDVFNKENGKFLHRIKVDFLNSKYVYKFKKINEKFLFFSNPYFKKNKHEKGSNNFIIAEISNEKKDS